MKIGIISDTHDDIESTQKAIEIFKERGVNFVIHLGDYISPPIVRLFKELKLIGKFFCHWQMAKILFNKVE